LADNTNLTHLDFYRSDIKMIDGLGNCTKLKELNLSYNKFIKFKNMVTDKFTKSEMDSIKVLTKLDVLKLDTHTKHKYESELKSIEVYKLVSIKSRFI